MFEELDVKNSIYEVPLELARQGLDLKVLELLRLEPGELDLDDYRVWLDGVLHPETECTVAVVGKYIRHQDAYKSIYEALSHAGIHHHAKVHFLPVEAEELETGDAAKILGKADAILVPAKGGTMRLGAYPCVLVPGSRSAELYNTSEISERHRHRYEFNPAFKRELEAAGLKVAGADRHRPGVRI